MPLLVEHRTDRSGDTIRLPGNDNTSHQITACGTTARSYTFATMTLANATRVVVVLAACIAAVGSTTSNNNGGNQNQTLGYGQTTASSPPPPQQMDPSRALGLWKSTFGAVKIEADNSKGGIEAGAVQGVWVYTRQGQEVIGYFAGNLRGNVLSF